MDRLTYHSRYHSQSLLLWGRVKAQGLVTCQYVTGHEGDVSDATGFPPISGLPMTLSLDLFPSVLNP